MRWEIADGQAILTLRSVIQSERWHKAWSLLHNDFCQSVQAVMTDGPEALDPAA